MKRVICQREISTEGTGPTPTTDRPSYKLSAPDYDSQTTAYTSLMLSGTCPSAVAIRRLGTNSRVGRISA